MRCELKPGEIIDRIFALFPFGEKGGIIIPAALSGYLSELLSLGFYCSLFDGFGKLNREISSNWFYGQNYTTVQVNTDQLRIYDLIPVGLSMFLVHMNELVATQ